jgi:hypothetical protein
MPIGDRIGGFIRPGFNPLLVADAPTIGTASESGSGISTTFTVPSDVGGGAITSYEATAKNTSSGALARATGTSSPITVSGLTPGQSYTVTVVAENAYGPSGASAASNSITIFNGAQLWLWGRNISGQLGQGNTTDYSSPVQVGALTTWKTVGGTGADATFAVKADGTAWSWGKANLGQTGHNNTTDLSSPVQIGALTTWIRLAGGYGGPNGGIKTDGTLWLWGKNTYGQLGQSNTTATSSPVQVGALTTWLKFAAGYYMGHAIKTDGTLWTTGGRNDNYGQLGTNNLTNYSSPVQIGALTDWSEVSSYNWNAGAIKTDGTIWMWGRNNFGQLGDGSVTTRSSPVQIGALTDWSKVAVGRDHTLALKTDGTLWAWGRNNYGQLGDGSITDRSSPVQIGSLTTWLELGAGYQNSGARTTANTLFSWGVNANGELGDGSTTNRSSPVQVGALTTWKATMVTTEYMGGIKS